MADYSNLCMCWKIVITREGTAKFGRRFERRKKILVNTRPTDPLRYALLHDAELGLFEVAHIHKRPGFVLEIVEVTVAGADGFGRDLDLGIRRKQINEPLRIATFAGMLRSVEC